MFIATERSRGELLWEFHVRFNRDTDVAHAASLRQVAQCTACCQLASGRSMYRMLPACVRSLNVPHAVSLRQVAQCAACCQLASGRSMCRMLGRDTVISARAQVASGCSRRRALDPDMPFLKERGSQVMPLL
jgi:hypothetical protein